LDHLKARSHDPTVEGARVALNSSPAAPARRIAVSSMLSPPASIDPSTVSALLPLLALCSASRSRWSTTSAKPIRCASAAAGSRPAFGIRFFSVKLTETRFKS